MIDGDENKEDDKYFDAINELFKYNYENDLRDFGWKDMITADGPSGFEYGYTKDGYYIIFSMSTKFLGLETEESPLNCPCIMTRQIIYGKGKSYTIDSSLTPLLEGG